MFPLEKKKFIIIIIFVVAIFRLNSDNFIAKQVEYSRIKRMCIFHVLTVRGLAGSEGASAPCMGLPGNAEAPLATRLLLHSIYRESRRVCNLFSHARGPERK